MGIGQLPSLRVLRVTDNKLRGIEGLGECRMLTVLEVQRNMIEEVNGLKANEGMRELWLEGNPIVGQRQ
jgi:Leucine-rich repeat (LRR) protein